MLLDITRSLPRIPPTLGNLQISRWEGNLANLDIFNLYNLF